MRLFPGTPHYALQPSVSLSVYPDNLKIENLQQDIGVSRQLGGTAARASPWILRMYNNLAISVYV